MIKRHDEIRAICRLIKEWGEKMPPEDQVYLHGVLLRHTGFAGVEENAGPVAEDVSASDSPVQAATAETALTEADASNPASAT